MKKPLLYSPENTGSFRMMFGFKQPTTYYKVKSIAKVRTKESLKMRNENK